MKLRSTNNNQQKIYKIIYLLLLPLLFSSGCKSEPINTDWEPQKPNLTISACEEGCPIYLDGKFTGKYTPAEIIVQTGKHFIGVGLKTSKHYLRRKITISDISEKQEIILTNNDLQQAKQWKALFVGVNQVTNGVCTTEYSTEQIDKAYEYFKWSFEENVEPWSYHTMNWNFERRDISDRVIKLSHDNLITPNIFESYVTNIEKGDYDLVVTFFRGTQESCDLGGFIGIAWYSVQELSSESSYYTIRYHDKIEEKINYSKANDPGVFIHEWLHTIAEMFYPEKGCTLPKDNDQVVHAAEKFGYTWPWMNWYQDIISGQVKENSKFLGIGPDAFLDCSVKENATGNCSANK